MRGRKVHVRDINGKLLYTRLYDDGGPILLFEGPSGFVDRLDVKRYRWRIEGGWPKTALAAMEDVAND